MAKRYNRIMLGRGGMYASQCRAEGFIGVDFLSDIDMTDRLSEPLQEFNKQHIPIWMERHPGRSKTAAGLACGNLWTVCKGLQIGDVVLSPSGKGEYYIGVIESDYNYVGNEILPHRRKVKWLDKTISRIKMSDKLRHATGSIGTCCDVSGYADEIEQLMNCGENTTPTSKTIIKQFHERDLHKLLCSSLRVKNIYAKTIFHEKTLKKADPALIWVHPDIVGVEIERFENDTTLSILKAVEPSEIVKIYSFELKKNIESDNQLKQYFFQALSNSSWANYGYLVAYDISESLNDEMSRLNEAFGIGIIKMDAREYQVLFPARERKLDYNTIEKLNGISPDFKEFISHVAKIITASKEWFSPAKLSLENVCDGIFHNDEEIEKYCNEHNIPF